MVSDDVVTRLARLVLVPVIEIPAAALAIPLADALSEGGLPVIEITFRTPEAAAAIEAIARERPDMEVGAGTVLTFEQVDRALDAGARFLVSPGFNPQVVAYAQSRKAFMLPGIVTPTEIEMAMFQGIKVVKFFPAEAAGGARYLQALAAPYRSMSFIPTGGIDADKLEAYLAVTQVLAVGGSWMAPRDLIANGEFEAITQRTQEAVALATRLRPAGAVKVA